MKPLPYRRLSWPIPSETARLRTELRSVAQPLKIRGVGATDTYFDTLFSNGLRLKCQTQPWFSYSGGITF